MCRLFGFRSIIQSQVHRSLISADNALLLQSEEHPDGWGVAYYVAHAPHVIKSASTAIDDHLFRHVSGIVTSETVLAHLRKATQGELSTINTHPFQYGTWIFAHNGNIANFPNLRPQLLARIPPLLRRFILGSTDSEVFFYMLLANMAKHYELHQSGYPLKELVVSVRQTVSEICEVTGPIHKHDHGPLDHTFLTFILTNGKVMIAHQGGKSLYYSTYKQHCPERDTCPSFAVKCEQPTQHGFVSHLIFSSEPLQGENVWEAMQPYEIIGVDGQMQLQHFHHEQSL